MDYPPTTATADLPSPEITESTLLRLARSGDERALDALCRQYWRPVYRSFAGRTDSPAEAEDLTQEVFLRALRAMPRFEDHGLPFRAYLLQIAHMLLQLVEKGSLLLQLARQLGKRTAVELYGSLKNMAKRLLDSVRYQHWPDEVFEVAGQPRIQIRLDSS